MLYLSLCISSHFFLGERMLFLFLSFFSVQALPHLLIRYLAIQ